MGQKRRFASDFKQALKTFDKATIFIDLFGGSGLLSHITKHEYPDTRVIYNDYDNFSKRLKGIDQTNALLSDIRKIVASIPKGKRLPQEVKEKVLSRIKKDEIKGYVDYITLSGSLLFSMHYVQNYENLNKEQMYNCVKNNNYKCDNYLDGLEVVTCDYQELVEKFKHEEKVVFIVDPPYLSTDSSPYKSYWNLSNHLDVLNALKSTPYIYFTSDKSQIIELLDWTSKNLNATNPLKGAIKVERSTGKTVHINYKDIMLYKPS